MRNPALALCLLAETSRAEPPPEPPWPTGCWAVHVRSPLVLLPDQHGTFNLTSDGSTVGGTVTMLSQDLVATEGVVSGEEFTFTVKVKSREVVVTGTRSGEGLAGTMVGPPQPLGWSAVRCP